MASLQFNAISFGNVVKLQLITITILITPTLVIFIKFINAYMKFGRNWVTNGLEIVTTKVDRKLDM